MTKSLSYDPQYIESQKKISEEKESPLGRTKEEIKEEDSEDESNDSSLEIEERKDRAHVEVADLDSNSPGKQLK